MAVACPECGLDLKPAFFESPEYRQCHICGTEISVLPFPACFVPPQKITAHDLHRGEEEASCFHHEARKAVHTCSRCGKFLCLLCAAEFGDDVLCPECLVTGERKGADARLERGRTLYHSIALALAVGPACTLSLSIFGAPAAVYMTLRYWRQPESIVRRYRWRRWAALLLGLAEIAFWIFIIAFTVTRSPTRGTTR
jgi:hypothetical protein